MIDPDRIGWSEPREGMLIGVVDKKIAALFYWHPQSRSWFWIPADKPYESFRVVHGEPRATISAGVCDRDWRGMIRS